VKLGKGKKLKDKKQRRKTLLRAGNEWPDLKPTEGKKIYTATEKTPKQEKARRDPR